MNDKQKIADLQAVLSQFLKPIKGIPFSLIIQSMSGHAVIPIELASHSDKLLVERLTSIAKLTGQLVEADPIRRNRPNEVGNDIEAYVIAAAIKLGLSAVRPKSKSGRGKATGYPDILMNDENGSPTYLGCKIFGEGSESTTMRSFYLSPSEIFKVAADAHHVLMAFGMEREPIAGSRDSFYKSASFKVVDLSALKCDVKYEFNSDNQRLYGGQLILAEGRL